MVSFGFNALVMVMTVENPFSCATSIDNHEETITNGNNLDNNFVRFTQTDEKKITWPILDRLSYIYRRMNQIR